MNQRSRRPYTDENGDSRARGMDTSHSSALPQRYVVICADDFGLHEKIDEACLTLARMGRISAISCMSAAPGWPGSIVSELSRLPIDLGLHLDFTEHPVDPRMRYPLAGLLAAAYSRRLPRAQVRREIHGQLDRFEKSANRAPDHIDGHQHVHQLPVIRDELADILSARYGDSIPWIRCTRAAGVSGTPLLKASIIGSLGCKATEEIALRLGARQNKRLLGIYGLNEDEEGYQRLITAWLRAARSADLVLCHPAFGWGSLGKAAYFAGPSRAAEFAVLSGEVFGAALAHQQIVVTRLSLPTKASSPTGEAGGASRFF